MKLQDAQLAAFYELMRNPTITSYTMEDGVERRQRAMDMPITFGQVSDGHC